MKYRTIKRSMNDICRSCLNEELHIDLEPVDCYYLMYPQMCRRCGEMKNIVTDIRWRKRIRLLLK